MELEDRKIAVPEVIAITSDPRTVNCQASSLTKKRLQLIILVKTLRANCLLKLIISRASGRVGVTEKAKVFPLSARMPDQPRYR